MKEELGQYSDIFKLLSTYHEEYCELVDADDQKHQVNWFDDLDQDVFNFKHKIHNSLKEFKTSWFMTIMQKQEVLLEHNI